MSIIVPEDMPLDWWCPIPNIKGSLSLTIFTIKQDCSKGFVDPTNISAQSRSSSMEAKEELKQAFNILKELA